MPSFRTILVAADFSGRSQEAFRVACALAEETKTRVFVLHAVEKIPVAEQPVAFGEMGVPFPLPADGSARHAAILDRLREAYTPNRPIDVEVRVRDGTAHEEILRTAGEVGADLIVLGTQGRTGLRRLLAGSVAEAVLRRATCPVLALHAPEDHPPTVGPIRVILHATDFSGHSRTSLRIARALARDHGARLLLLHVEATEGVVLAPPLDPRSYLEPLIEMQAKTEGPDLKHPVEVRCERGDPATEILRVAEECRSDLIVLGSHGRTALGRLLMGSVAEAVLRRATCPTLIIKSSAPRPT
jgi:nucleotide-binding universal stress UspA family protein